MSEWAQSGVIAAPRLVSLFATRLWAYNSLRLMDAPRMGSSLATRLWACSLATRVWTFLPSGLMVAPRLRNLLATRVWTFWSSRLMVVAPGLGDFQCHLLWTWVSSGRCQRRIVHISWHCLPSGCRWSRRCCQILGVVLHVGRLLFVSRLCPYQTVEFKGMLCSLL